MEQISTLIAQFDQKWPNMNQKWINFHQKWINFNQKGSILIKNSNQNLNSSLESESDVNWMTTLNLGF